MHSNSVSGSVDCSNSANMTLSNLIYCKINDVSISFIAFLLTRTVDAIISFILAKHFRLKRSMLHEFPSPTINTLCHAFYVYISDSRSEKKAIKRDQKEAVIVKRLLEGELKEICHINPDPPKIVISKPDSPKIRKSKRSKKTIEPDTSLADMKRFLEQSQPVPTDTTLKPGLLLPKQILLSNAQIHKEVKPKNVNAFNKNQIKDVDYDKISLAESFQSTQSQDYEQMVM